MHKRAAVMQDLSGLGHCSLSAAMAVLPVLGVQCCAVPTCVLSTQTDGYDGFSFCDLTQTLDRYLAHWESLGERFDAVYTGYLGSAEQLGAAKRLIGMKKPDGIVLVDPVMGDDGALYSAVDPDMPRYMRLLIANADLITPNLTEACLLLGRSPSETKPEKALELAHELAAFGPKKVVISGIAMDKTVGMALWDEGKTAFIEKQRVPYSYPGSGDVFACVLLGKLLGGADFEDAVSSAADFVRSCIEGSVRENAPRREGLVFEPRLPALLS